MSGNCAEQNSSSADFWVGEPLRRAPRELTLRDTYAARLDGRQRKLDPVWGRGHVVRRKINWDGRKKTPHKIAKSATSLTNIVPHGPSPMPTSSVGIADEPWPPRPPDVSTYDLLAAIEPQPFAVSSNSMIYRFRACRKAYKSRGSQREYDMMIASGDYSIKLHGRAFFHDVQGRTFISGFIMDLETPLEPKAVSDESQRHVLMNGMIAVVLALYGKGIIHGDLKPPHMLLCSNGKIRLYDFAEARKVDEDLNEWEGMMTVNYMSPYRCRDWSDRPDPPPTIEDDLYGLGLNIWELHTGKIPFEDVYMDDILDTVKTGKTVDVDEVREESIREIIRKYLRCGGAKV